MRIENPTSNPPARGRILEPAASPEVPPRASEDAASSTPTSPRPAVGPEALRIAAEARQRTLEDAGTRYVQSSLQSRMDAAPRLASTAPAPVSSLPGGGNYSHAFVLVAPETSGPTGHVMLAFGDENGPQVVFNQGGVGGGLWGDDAKLSRMSWEEAKAYLIPAGVDYQVHSIHAPPEGVRAMFDHANEAFEAASPTDNPLTRERGYHAVFKNCTTLTRDALRAGGVDVNGRIFRPVGLRDALDALARQGSDDGVTVTRSFIVHGAEGTNETASPWL